MSIKHDPPLVLVADDEVNTTIMLQHIFEREGYRVERVNNGLAALDAARTMLPDLILLDILMPGMNGFEVLRLLREDVLTNSIPTILITANAREPTDVARGMNLGADDYLYKPFAPQELLARAQSKIRARQLEEALQRRSQELAALLRVSEELQQHLEVSQVVELILNLVLELLPGDVTVIHQINEDGTLAESHYQIRPHTALASYQPDPAVGAQYLQVRQPVQWPGDTKPLERGFFTGMASPLQHGDALFGVLVLLSREAPAYDENQLRLFEGIARQAGLAIRNAQLYEIQANYALHLEDMVAQRTAALEAAQKQLVRSEKLASIGQIAASVAHEIGNPLQAIRPLLDGVVEDLETRGVIVERRDIEMIQESLARIDRIVKSLLRFAKDDPNAKLVSLNLAEVIEAVLALNRKYLMHNRITINTDIPSLPSIIGSKDQLEAVFMNLTLNAVASMEKGGTLTINACADDEYITVDFSDTGHGIPEDKLHKIFDPFFSTKPNGTGLGLSVSYGVIEAHHGSIEVASQVNVGTTFTIRLPIQRTDNPA